MNPLFIARKAVEKYNAGQKIGELAAAISLVYSVNPVTVLEIGTANGGSIYAWSKIPSVLKIVGVDVDNNDHRELMRWGQTYNNVVGDSKSVEREVVDLFPTGIDFIFIDGNHSADYARSDFDMYRKYLNPGGVIGFHDIVKHWTGVGCEVEQVWNEVKYQYGGYIELVSDYTDNRGWGPWGGIGLMSESFCK